MSEENEAVDTSCCASCGIAEIDDIKLKDCDGCDLVKYSAMNAGKIMHQVMKMRARNERRNYVMNYYSSNRKTVIWGTARSAVYLCRLIQGDISLMNVAAK